ncbi:complex I intermediate-associated protein 30-domain-containing protein [Melampsora americana]|nr:complex I intermediate-associated protein 30-domain-containing protein [Melampsora americana]
MGTHITAGNDQSEAEELVLKAPDPPSQEIGLLFGSILNPWVPSDWVEVSDQVRGGSSTAYLELLEPSFPTAGVRFHGTLDTSTLGGAGFASQSYEKKLLSFPEDRFTGLVLDVKLCPSKDTSDIRTFTIVLKNDPAGPDVDGRRQSTVSYEFDFTLPATNPTSDSEPPLDWMRSIPIPFSELRATYRGRPKPDAKKFDPSHITALSIMCRSFFDGQSGPFSLAIVRIGVLYSRGANE